MAKINWGEVVGALGKAVGTGSDVYSQKLALDEENNLTPLQRATTISRLHPELGKELLKQSRIQQTQNAINTNFPDLAESGVNTPSRASRNAVQSFSEPGMTANLPGIGVNSPPGSEMPTGNIQTAPQQNQPAQNDPQGLRTQADRYRKRAAAYTSASMPDKAKVDLSQADALDRRADTLQKTSQRTYESERDYATKTTENFRNRMSGISASLPAKDLALQLARQAIESGEVGAFSGAHLAQLTGSPVFQSASGAGLNLASKENLVGNLARVSGRAQNRWLEQVMSGAFPRVGQSETANLTVQEGVEADKALTESELQIYRQLEDQDLKTQGYVGKDIEQRVEKAFKPIAREILERTSYRTRQLWEREKSDKDLLHLAYKKAPTGVYLTRRMAQIFLKLHKDPKVAVEKAKEKGYRIPSNAEADEWGL
jgi:hypothetical protein